MTTLLIGASTLVVAVVGWYGHKAWLRIEIWGRNLNDLDRIFQRAGEHDEVGEASPMSPSGVPFVPKLETHRRSA